MEQDRQVVEFVVFSVSGLSKLEQHFEEGAVVMNVVAPLALDGPAQSSKRRSRCFLDEARPFA